MSSVAIPAFSAPATPDGDGHDLRWFLAASYATWIICAVPPIAEIAAGRLRGWRAIAWSACYLLFGIAMAGIGSGRARGGHPRVVPVSLLLVESVTGLAAVFLSGNGLTSAVLVIVAAQLPHLLSLRSAVIWVGAQTLANAVIVARHNWINGLTGGIAIGGFQLFALASSVLAASERAARRTLAAAHAELLATRARLAESSRSEERLRIARDLHDTLGHHLTALSLQLDVASRLADGKAAAQITEAHAITRLLLSDVRDVVSQMRDERRPDLAEALRALAASSHDPIVHLTLPPSLELDAEPRAQALLRGVQEIITNTVRHARARNLWITIERREGGLELVARDDGRGASTVVQGHGLTGMRERFEDCAGRVTFTTHPGKGFEVRGFIPDEPAAS
jgi:signal transduction histidine kinase